MASTAAFAAMPAFGVETHLLEGSFGPDGSAASEFLKPWSLGVDQLTGNIYVASLGGTIEKFDKTPAPQLFEGSSSAIVEGQLTGFSISPIVPQGNQIAVDSSSGDLYVVGGGSSVDAYQSSGEPAKFSQGPGKGSNEIGSEACGVAVDSSGDIYVSEFATGVRVFAASGEPITSIPRPGFCNLAVGPNGDLYASSPEGSVEKLVPDPAQLPVTALTTYIAESVIESEAFTIAVDPTSGDLDIDEGDKIAEYNEAGTLLGTFGAGAQEALGRSVGLAINGTSGKVYVSNSIGGLPRQIEIFGPTILIPDVDTAKATAISPKGIATLNGAVNPEGVALSECQFEYVEEAHYEAAAGDPYATGATAPCIPAAGVIPTGEETEVHADITGLTPGVTYHYRLRASNKTSLNSNPPNFGSDETFSTLPKPAISGERTSNLIKASVDLDARINSGDMGTTYHFEYDTRPYAQGEAPHGTSTPEESIQAGAEPVSVMVHVENLQANREYHWRVVATNEAGTTTAVDQTFVYDTSGESLPDNRAYEMVTPPSKNAALLNDVVFGLKPDIAEGGSRLIMTSIQCFAGAESCTASSENAEGEQFLFTRTNTAWLTSALAPKATQFEENVAVLVSAESGTELFGIPTPPGLEDDFYVRESDGSLVDVGPATPPSDGPVGQPWSGKTLVATNNFSRIVFQGNAFWPFAAGSGDTVYEFSGTGNAAPRLVGVSGGVGSTSVISACQTELGGGYSANNPGDISADGETVYFTANECGEGTGENAGPGHLVPVNELFARIGGARTVAISEPSAFRVRAPYAGCSEEPCIKDVNEPVNWSAASFAGASSDGSKAFFTSNQRLMDAAGLEGNLYEYDFNNKAAEDNLVDVSAGDVSGQEPRVRGVVAISADGSHVYFVAKGILSKALNDQGRAAQEGANNLYVFARETGQPNGEIHFIAQLPEADQQQWEGNDGTGRANVTPDGRFLVFESHGSLTSDDTRTDGATQIFRYDAQTGELARLSIGERGFDDNGNNGLGNAQIVAAYEGATHAGVARSDPTMSNDGRYVFFESPVQLTPHAVNDIQIGTIENKFENRVEPVYAENVYEWQGGQVYLISDGKDRAVSLGGRNESAVKLLGSDGTGANVFFSTADPLVAKDTDTQVDYYDARICASENDNPCISEPLPALPACDGENCHGTPAVAPSLLVPGSASFNGEGNLRPTVAKPKVLTRVQKRADALRACRKKLKKARRSCERRVRIKYESGGGLRGNKKTNGRAK